MKKIKIIATAAALFGLSATTMTAQVGINTETPTTKGLDIVVKDQTADKGNGFRLEDGNQGSGKILMSDADGKGTWFKTAIPSVTITAQPKGFNWSRLVDSFGDPNGPATATITPLTVTAVSSSGATITYQWYEDMVGLIPNQAITGATTNTYAPPVSAWGGHSYYCVVDDGTSSVQSDIAHVAIGCGAAGTDGIWYSFACYNLGADPTVATNPFEWKSTGDNVDGDIKGYLYQWGRRGTDGHQMRGSLSVSMVDNPTLVTASLKTDYPNLIITDQIPASTNYTGKFISSDRVVLYDWHWPQYDMLWQNFKNNNDPCPAGWMIPSINTWQDIISGSAQQIVPENATANAWVWTNSGYSIKPDGSTTPLFLPAAGRRINTSAALSSVGNNGYYWSSSPAPTSALSLLFTATYISPADSPSRAYGNSVRCVKQ